MPQTIDNHVISPDFDYAAQEKQARFRQFEEYNAGLYKREAREEKLAEVKRVGLIGALILTGVIATASIAYCALTKIRDYKNYRTVIHQKYEEKADRFLEAIEGVYENSKDW